MAITVASLVTNLNTYLGDSSTDRVTDAERLQYLTEATVWLQEELGNEHMVETYPFDYFDTVHQYKITTAVADLLIGADLRRDQDYQTRAFTRKSERELAEDIANASSESAWAVERRDGDSYLVINHSSLYPAKIISSFDALTSGGGTWTADTTNSDATNLTVDTNEYVTSNSSLNFDVDVSQSGNNRATIYNDTLSSLDLSDYEDISSFVVDVYIPAITNFTSVTFYWGSSDTSYWSATKTTSINGDAWVVGWNKVKFNWADATATSSPDETAVDYIRIDLNYGAGYTDDTDFRLDNLILARPENLTFHYVSWNVGDTSTSDTTKLTSFAATTNVPFFSGRYDQYRYSVAHKATSLAFSSLRLREDAIGEENSAFQALARARKIFETSKVKEQSSFKVHGISFNKRR